MLFHPAISSLFDDLCLALSDPEKAEAIAHQLIDTAKRLTPDSYSYSLSSISRIIKENEFIGGDSKKESVAKKVSEIILAAI
ncbi:hypothetical protein [Chromobacterium haemolyticum]|uniref:hypothetical protein n=1 Tax=Chromobacterium haemolyticum TaxID=394935 RepID=UPI00131982AB|nr:hypothetical protein [Chromobacterium haemolyticum]BBH11702.1 hypothetical protein CH06BL_09500 [Chromobacterium haemolyticum]